MYYEDNVKIKIDWKGLILKLIAVILLILVFIWLFPIPKLDTFYNRVYNENLNNMKDVAEKYFVNDNLPNKTGSSNTIKLQDMLDKKLITEFTDKDNKECSTTNSFAQVTKTENNNYVLKVQLSCDDKTDYVLETLNTANAGTGSSNTSSNNRESKDNGSSTSNNQSKDKSDDDKDEDDGIEIDASIINSGDSKYDKGGNVEYEYKRAITKTSTTYTCPEGYVKDNNVCYKYETGETIPATPLYFDDVVQTTDAKENKSGGYTKYAEAEKIEVSSEDVCPEGYTKNGNICYKYVNATVIPGTTTYECPNGYTLSGTSCIATTQRIENKTGSYTCPSGYTISADKLRCTSTVNATRTSTSGSTTCNCPSGYRDNGGNCVRTYTGSYHAGSTNYGNCPSGWSPSGSQCTRAANATRSWSNPSCSTSSTKLSEYENSSSKRVKTGQNCTARGCTYTYCTYTAITNYSCPQGNRNGSTCYTSRPSSTSSSYYTCNDGRTQSSSTCYEYANKNCSTTPGTTKYSCPSGYNLNSNNTCTRTVNSTYNSSTTYSCPTGYTMSGTQCIKTTPATPHTSETQYTCPTGYVREGTTCYQYTTPTTKKTYKYECPTGYKKEGEGENTKCSIYVEDKTTYYCESAEEQLVDGKCIKTIKGGLKGYSCPDGYILDKDKCIKHSLECAEPIAITNTSTTYEYKWSSEPSLDGWTPTGKTRGTATEENLYDK